MNDKSKGRIAQIKERDTKFLEGTKLKEDWEWLIRQFDFYQDSIKPLPLEEWHEDDGDCLWWFFPIGEPPYCGSPLDEYFPDYVTHFTRILTPLNN